MNSTATNLCTRYGEILKSDNYNLFHKLKGNRKINEAHVLALMQSLKQVQLIVPIIVNSKMEIIDGQHRYEACRRLELPIYYIGMEGYGIEECHILNANNRTYKPEDFLKGYTELGYEEYKKFSEFRLKYPFLSMHLCQIYLLGGVRKDRDLNTFKQGNFKVDNWDKACLWAERTYDFLPYAKGFLTNRNFNTTMLRMYQHDKYDHKKMIHKASLQAGEFRLQGKEKYFMEMMCNIYNFRSREDEKIYPHELQKRNTY